MPSLLFGKVKNGFMLMNGILLNIALIGNVNQKSLRSILIKKANIVLNFKIVFNEFPEACLRWE